jgi:S-formylglutathione hydrolase
VADDPDGAWDFGLGAGFYVNATEEPWAAHYQMRSYIERELPALIAAEFPVDMTRQAIMGHSMGGHGALTIALRNPDTYHSVSAFSPIVAPSQVQWGHKALGGYLGADRADWAEYDTVALIEGGARLPDLLVDQGDTDGFLAEQLRTELLVAACEKSGQPATIRMQPGYDHSYYFISTFMENHLRWHAERLG